MITDQQFDRIQEILNQRSHPRGSIRKDLLTGIMKCGQCGRSIIADVKVKKYKNGKSQTFIYYRCSKKWNGQKCLQKYVTSQDLDRQINEILDNIQLPTQIVDWALKWLKVIHSHQIESKMAQYKSLEQSYQQCNLKLSRIVDLALAELITTEEAMEKKEGARIEKG